MVIQRKENDSASPDLPPVSGTSEAIEGEPRTRLLLVDDDGPFREAAAAALAEFGFDVVTMGDGAEMFAFFDAGQNIDVIVLDWKLPTVCGVDLLPRLRRRGVKAPVIILTGMSATSHELAALDRGALDFVEKGRGMDVLAKRARLVLEAGKRPAELLVEAEISRGRLVLRPNVSRAYWDGVDLSLTVTEYNIVHLLASRAGDYVTYRQIYDCVHHVGFIGGYGEDGYHTNVRSSVKRIRAKFRKNDAEFSEIENFSAFGYRWRAAANSAA
jgi:two-component system response regulator ChvI